MLDIIEYRNEVFPSRSLYISGWGNVLISTHELQDQLLDESGENYKDSTAQLIDEKIFYFVKHKQIRMSEEALGKTIREELDQ
jgi:hypothetical protein